MIALFGLLYASGIKRATIFNNLTWIGSEIRREMTKIEQKQVSDLVQHYFMSGADAMGSHRTKRSTSLS